MGSTNISSVAGRFARHFADATGTSKDIGSPSNALRHGLWSAMIRSEFDAGIRYNTGKNMTYALWTGHSEDMTPNSILYQGISKLSFEIHSHPGSTLIPSPVNGMTEGDYGAAAWVDSEFAKNKNYPRHFMYSKQGKHLWEYNYYNEKSSKFYPGNPSVKKPMPVGATINLKTLRK
ncbi:hypothetical protein D1632_08735 [Chryseobacterium nematophagum]|uniref:Uncharacterized protein n=1 Tax=Chryseobacterium nematophagum TaxID=2305228 RepID=A0A3M7LCH4_9FLAO|nr:hypothetical protein [Chryseobacterium nematophagum]RMZ59700.1 hypothetical protein D1632_08735 [Chryseobacterium nematophagum]